MVWPTLGSRTAKEQKRTGTTKWVKMRTTGSESVVEKLGLGNAV